METSIGKRKRPEGPLAVPAAKRRIFSSPYTLKQLHELIINSDNYRTLDSSLKESLRGTNYGLTLNQFLGAIGRLSQEDIQGLSYNFLKKIPLDDPVLTKALGELYTSEGREIIIPTPKDYSLKELHAGIQGTNSESLGLVSSCVHKYLQKNFKITDIKAFRKLSTVRVKKLQGNKTSNPDFLSKVRPILFTEEQLILLKATNRDPSAYNRQKLSIGLTYDQIHQSYLESIEAETPFMNYLYSKYNLTYGDILRYLGSVPVKAPYKNEDDGTFEIDWLKPSKLSLPRETLINYMGDEYSKEFLVWSMSLVDFTPREIFEALTQTVDPLIASDCVSNRIRLLGLHIETVKGYLRKSKQNHENIFINGDWNKYRAAIERAGDDVDELILVTNTNMSSLFTMEERVEPAALSSALIRNGYFASSTNPAEGFDSEVPSQATISAGI